MTLYIAGKMSGLPNKGRDEFIEAEKFLKSKGHIVLNPACLPENLMPDQYMPICLAMLQQAEGIVLLDNWKDSNGAKLEMKYAQYQGKDIFQLKGMKKSYVEKAGDI